MFLSHHEGATTSEQIRKQVCPPPGWEGDADEWPSEIPMVGRDREGLGPLEVIGFNPIAGLK